MRNCSHKVSMIFALLTVTAFAAAGGQAKKVDARVETRVERIEAPVRYEFSRTVRTGRVVKAQDGRDGFVKRTYRITEKNGKSVKELVKEERREAEPTLMLMSRSGYQTSRGSFSRGKVLTMRATGYHSMVTGSGRTKLGMRARKKKEKELF